MSASQQPNPAMPASRVSALDRQIDEMYTPQSFLQRAAASMLQARYPVVAVVFLALIALCAIFATHLAPKDPNRVEIFLTLKPPLSTNREGDIEHVLGTDSTGRDVLSRVIYGARISFFVGLAAVGLGGGAGTILGLTAGYLGGRVDDLIMRLADIQLAYPFILFAIMMLTILGEGVLNLILVLGIGQWVTYARIARAETLVQREREYVEAVRALGATEWRIMFRTILPNILTPLIVIASFNVAGVILSEASLSFLGLGVPESVPTWGAMLANSRNQLLSGSWWLAVFPGLAIMFTVVSLNILGDWMRDFLDPRLRGSGQGL
ncbi:MAG: ABC transporter permease [Chloroflexota bacterium]|nr:ABC transporter permease [Chloroflexota bacterium]MDE2945597.1 ABC transporter permease [Chloroflexota bacterium]